MEELDFDHTVFSPQQAESDKSLAVRFYMQALRDESKSIEEGRPIFVDTEMIEIRVRGDRNNIVIRPVREDDKRRFRQAYGDFKANKERTVDGTPLTEWPAMSASMAEELRYLGFYTVEQLAEANEAALSKVPGLLTMKNRAKLFLEFAKGISPIEQLQRTVESLMAQQQVFMTNQTAQNAAYEDLDRKYKALLEKHAATA